MADKYGFRLYGINDTGDIYSPYMDLLSSNPELRASGKYNQVQYANNNGKRSKPRTIFRPSISDIDNIHYNKSPHYGFSFLGLEDPKFSLYNSKDLYNDDYVHRFDPIIQDYSNNLKGQQIFNKYYKHNEKDDASFLNNDQYTTAEKLNAIYDAEKEDSQQWYNPDKNYFANNINDVGSILIKPEFFDYDNNTDDRYDNLITRMDNLYTLFTNPDQSPFMKASDKVKNNKYQMALIKVPLETLQRSTDAFNRDTSAQRDYPEELVAYSLTPLKDIGDVSKAAFLYNKLRKKGASGTEAFGDVFNIDPNKVVSDKSKKQIIKEMSTDYQKYVQTKNIKDSLSKFKY